MTGPSRINPSSPGQVESTIPTQKRPPRAIWETARAMTGVLRGSVHDNRDQQHQAPRASRIGTIISRSCRSAWSIYSIQPNKPRWLLTI